MSYDEYGSTLEQEYRFLETHARFGSVQVAGSLRSMDLLLQDVIDTQFSTPDLPADTVQRHQLNKLRQFPEIHYLITTDNKGQVATAESLDDPTGVIEVRKFNASQRDYFAVHRDAKPEDYYRYQLSRPFKTITNRHTITVSRAIRGKNGQFQGVALVSLSPAYFDAVMQQVLANDGADAAALHNRFGDIIYRKPDPDKYVGKNIAGGDAFKLYLRSDQQLTRYLGVTATDGVKRILVFSKVGDTNLDIGVSAQFDVVMSGWRSDLLEKVLTFVIAAGLLLALAWGSQRRLLERRRNEEALLESEFRWKFAIEGSGDGLWDWNLVDNSLFLTTRWKEMLGFTDDEIGTGIDEWEKRIHPEDKAATLATVQDYFDGKIPIYVCEHRVRCKDGSYKWILDRGMVVSRSDEGKPLRMIGTYADITKRMRNEVELKQHRHHLEALVQERTVALSLAKDAAEAASRAKSTFLSNMSHELRTPMNAIMGMTGIALRHAEDPKLRDQLGKIDHASQHLLAVINDILDISKIEAERLTLENRNFTLGEVLENLMHLISHKVEEKRLKLRIDLSPDVARLTLRGDPLRLGQILLNLTANAVKFTEAGTITLRADLAEESPTDVLLRFEVQDTGIGISPEDHKRLFTAFEQADGSMTRKYGGTGLGLAISKRLAKLMGGDIGVDSQPGVGSTFWITVRLGKAPTVNGTVPPAPTLSRQPADERLLDEFAGTRILLAEDEPINQEVSRGLLEDVGLAVDLAEDGVQAVEMAKQNRYALILMDMQMPHLNGVDATRAIRALPGYAETPILAMTANAFDEDRQVCIEAGMNDHIGKPVDPDKLFETLLKWLGQAK